MNIKCVRCNHKLKLKESKNRFYKGIGPLGLACHDKLKAEFEQAEQLESEMRVELTPGIRPRRVSTPELVYDQITQILNKTENPRAQLALVDILYSLKLGLYSSLRAKIRFLKKLILPRGYKILLDASISPLLNVIELEQTKRPLVKGLYIAGGI